MGPKCSAREGARNPLFFSLSDSTTFISTQQQVNSDENKLTDFSINSILLSLFLLSHWVFPAFSWTKHLFIVFFWQIKSLSLHSLNKSNTSYSFSRLIKMLHIFLLTNQFSPTFRLTSPILFIICWPVKLF